jgi:hypothetical protein
MEKKNEFVLNLADDLAFIEDGINAAHALATCNEDITGQVLTEEEHHEAQEWIFNHLIDDMQEIRAKVSREIGLRMNA